MWEKETCYKFALKKNLIFDFCQHAYKDNAFDYDMILITKDKHKIPVHRVIFALVSGIFKELDVPVEMLTLNLPDFSSSVVESLIEFIYSGSVLLDSSLRDDFIALCNELRINFPEELLENQPVEVVEAPSAESVPIKVEDENEMLVEEYSETDQDYVVQVVPEDENFDETEDGSCSTQNYTPENTILPTRQPLHKQVVPKFQTKYEKSFDNTSLNSSMPHANIQEALADIANGLNTMEAARKYGIPKTTLYRWAKKAKVK